METKGALLYEGKAKQVYAHAEDPKLVVQFFKDSASAFDGVKKGVILNKGPINCQISASIFRFLEERGVPTHFVDCPSDREMVIRKLDMLQVEVVVRNLADGSICRRYGTEKGFVFEPPLVEFFYKSDEHHDPLITEDHIRVFSWASDEQVARMKALALKVNAGLQAYFAQIGVTIADFKLEFGVQDGALMLGDEISPDSCRLFDTKTGEKLDKDVFRFDTADPDEVYRKIYERVLSL
jgi:phosphoribosylaminoimidazole-succinocarboxamide synthase